MGQPAVFHGKKEVTVGKGSEQSGWGVQVEVSELGSDHAGPGELVKDLWKVRVEATHQRTVSVRNDDVLRWNWSSGDGEAWADLGVMFGGTDSVLGDGFGSWRKKGGIKDDSKVST